MINFKVGIMGAGKIAGVIADTLKDLDAFEAYAIASRDTEKAAAFAKEHGVTKYYGSYEELVADPDVELIYIATPHSHHAEHAKLCLNAGKPVLVEKAFSYNAATTEEVLNLAKEKNLFCGEAMWIRFMPMYRLMAEYIQKGAIGRVNNITCSLGYSLLREERLTKPELAGGALLDLGVYPLNLISMIYGSEPPMIGSTCAKLDTGVDAQEALQISYKGGRCANAFVTMMYQPDNNAKSMVTADISRLTTSTVRRHSVFTIRITSLCLRQRNRTSRQPVMNSSLSLPEMPSSLVRPNARRCRMQRHSASCRSATH